MGYIIVERTHQLESNAKAADAYSGPSCAMVGVQSGKVYTDLLTANLEAVLMVSVNPVGFAIYQIGDNSPISEIG